MWSHCWILFKSHTAIYVYYKIQFHCLHLPTNVRNDNDFGTKENETKTGQWTMMIMSNEDQTKIVVHPTTQSIIIMILDQNDIVTVQCCPKPWACQHAIITGIGSTLKYHTKMIIMVIIVMHVSSCIQLAACDCISIVSEQCAWCMCIHFKHS